MCRCADRTLAGRRSIPDNAEPSPASFRPRPSRSARRVSCRTWSDRFATAVAAAVPPSACSPSPRSPDSASTHLPSIRLGGREADVRPAPNPNPNPNPSRRPSSSSSSSAAASSADSSVSSDSSSSSASGSTHSSSSSSSSISEQATTSITQPRTSLLQQNLKQKEANIESNQDDMKEKKMIQDKEEQSPILDKEAQNNNSPTKKDREIELQARLDEFQKKIN